MISNPELLLELTRRRLIERYIGSSFVVLWVVLAPLIPLATSLAVFYFVARIPAIQSMGLPTYAVYVFSGLLPFRVIQTAALDASNLLVDNMEILKSVNFPLHFLSLTSIAALLIEFGFQLLVMFALLLVSGKGVGPSLALLPLALILLAALVVGASWVLSVFGYLLKDLREIVTVAFSVLLYLSPVIYPAEALPHLMATLVYLNPVSHYVILFRDALVQGTGHIHWESWLVATTISVCTFFVGWLSIQRTRRFVGDMV